MVARIGHMVVRVIIIEIVSGSSILRRFLGFVKKKILVISCALLGGCF